MKGLRKLFDSKKLLLRLHEQAKKHGVNPLVFTIIYLFSYVPFYVGIFLMGGSLADAKSIDFANTQALVGFLLTAGAWISPYLYVEIAGKDLPIIVHILIFAFMATCLWCFFL